MSNATRTTYDVGPFFTRYPLQFARRCLERCQAFDGWKRVALVLGVGYVRREFIGSSRSARYPQTPSDDIPAAPALG
jgi:hypothetical protein